MAGVQPPHAGESTPEVAEKAGVEAEERIGETAEQTRRLADEARREAQRISSQAMRRGAQIVREQKDAAAAQVGGVARALHETAQHLGGQNQAQVARYAGLAADGLDQLSRALRDSDVDELIQRVSDYARRQPAVFIGGAVAAGFLLSRLLQTPLPGEAVQTESAPNEPPTSAEVASPGAPDIERGEVR